MKIPYLPDYLCGRPLEITPEFFKKIGAKIVLCDLDNTLAEFNSSLAPQEAKDWVQNLQANGLKVAVVSNGHTERVKSFADSLVALYLANAAKPLKGPSVRFVKKLGYKPNEVVFIGDQMYTDIKTAKKAGFKAILCEIISPKESILTYSNRKKDVKARKEMNEKHLVPHWRENI